MVSKHWTELRDDAVKTFGKKVKGKTKNQEIYLKAMETSTLTICTGPAGTGKSYMAAGLAAQFLKENKVEKLVLSRPLLECDEEAGTLPGDLWEKIKDMMTPIMDALEEFLTHDEIEKYKREKRILIVPLGKMRGSTFKKSFVILDEAQNATKRQMKMFLTRFGTDTRVVVCGDHTQSDLPYNGHNSLMDAIDRFRPNCNPAISIVELGREDIVRHSLIQWIDERYEKPIHKWFNCPSCKSRCFIPVEFFLLDKLCACWKCKKVVEIRNEFGKIDPMVVDENKECDSKESV